MPNQRENDSDILPGLKPVLETLSSKPEKIVQVFCKKGLYKTETRQIADLCSRHNIPIKYVELAILQRLCSKHASKNTPVSHQGVVARIIEKEFCSLEQLLEKTKNSPLPLILALDQVQDMGNLGTLARTLYALGGGGIILPNHSSALPGPAAMRASAGALQELALARVPNIANALDFAEETGFVIYGTGCANSSGFSGKKTAAVSSEMINAFTMPIELPAIIILGNENRGIRPHIVKRCKYFLHIPMPRKFDSLNVAQTGAILTGLCAAQNYNMNIISENNI